MFTCNISVYFPKYILEYILSSLMLILPIPYKSLCCLQKKNLSVQHSAKSYFMGTQYVRSCMWPDL